MNKGGTYVTHPNLSLKWWRSWVGLATWGGSVSVSITTSCKSNNIIDLVDYLSSNDGIYMTYICTNLLLLLSCVARWGYFDRINSTSKSSASSLKLRLQADGFFCPTVLSSGILKSLRYLSLRLSLYLLFSGLWWRT